MAERRIRNPQTGEEAIITDDGSIVPVTSARRQSAQEPVRARIPSQPWQGDPVTEWLTDVGQVGGQAVGDYVRGIGVATGLLDREQALAQQAANQAALEKYRERSPKGTFVADYAPEIMVGALDRGRSLVRSMGMAGTEGLRLRDTAEDQVEQGAQSAAFAAAFPMVARIWRGARGLVDNLRPEVVARAERAGLPVTAGEVAGGEGLLSRLDDMGEDIPGGNIFAADPKQTRQAMLNRAANEAIGESGDEILQTTRMAAADRLRGNWRTLGQSAPPVEISQGLRDRISTVYSRMKKRQGLGSFQGLAPGGDGVVDMDELLEFHRIMVRQADLADNIDSGLSRDIIQEVVNPLDDIIERQLSPEMHDLWRTTREQSRFLNLLNTGKSVTGTNVNPASLATRLQRNMPEVIQMGDGERLFTDQGRNLVEMTSILSDPAMRAGNQSGTARRLGQLGAAAAAADTVATGGATVAGPIAGAMAGNAIYQGASRRAPYLMGDMANQVGQSVLPLGNPGSFLDEFLFPYVGAEDEREAR